MKTFTFSAISSNLNKALDNQRTAAMFITLALTQATLVHGKLNMAHCWDMLGFAGEPTKSQKLAYARANNLQKRAGKVFQALDGAKDSELWQQFAPMLEQIDFTAAYAKLNFKAVEMLAFENGIYIADGADVLAFLTKASGAVVGSQLTTETAKADAKGEAEGDEDDLTGTDTADKVAELQRQKQAAKAIIESAMAVDVIADALVKVAGLEDPQLIVATLINAWQADRKALLAQIPAKAA